MFAGLEYSREMEMGRDREGRATLVMWVRHLSDFEYLRSSPTMCRVGCGLEGNRKVACYPPTPRRRCPRLGHPEQVQPQTGGWQQDGAEGLSSQMGKSRSRCLVFIPLAPLSAKQFTSVILFYSLSNPVR